jgi:hypothetical protein
MFCPKFHIKATFVLFRSDIAISNGNHCGNMYFCNKKPLNYITVHIRVCLQANRSPIKASYEVLTGWSLAMGPLGILYYPGCWTTDTVHSFPWPKNIYNFLMFCRSQIVSPLALQNMYNVMGYMTFYRSF